MDKSIMTSKKVFISYSHDNKDHENWVLKLATDLRSHGVDVIFDAWDLRLGADLRFFMEQGLSSANMVLCICSSQYVEKVNSGHGGSGYEGMIMTQALLKNANMDYIIPVIRNNISDHKIPFAFGSKLYIDFSDDSQYFLSYQTLLERIYDEDAKKKPPLGQNPFIDDIAKQVIQKTRIESVKYHSPALEGSVLFRFDNNNGLYLIGNGDYLFETRWSRAGNDSIHAYGRIGFLPELTEFPKYNDISQFDFSSSTRTIRKGQIIIYMNENSRFAAIKLGSVKSSGHGNSYDEMFFDYKIYRPQTQE